MGWEKLLPGLLAYMLLALCLGLAWVTFKKHGGKALGPAFLLLALMAPWGSGQQVAWLILAALATAHGFREDLADAWWARTKPDEPWRQRQWQHVGPVGPLLEGLRALRAAQSPAGRQRAHLRWALGAFAFTFLLLILGGIRQPGQAGLAWGAAASMAAWAAFLTWLGRAWWLRRAAREPGPSTAAWAAAWLPLLEQAHPQSPVLAHQDRRAHHLLPAWQEKGTPIWDELLGSHRRYVRGTWWTLALALPNGAQLWLRCDRASKQHSKRPNRARDRWQLRGVLRWPPDRALGLATVEEAWGEAAPQPGPGQSAWEGRFVALPRGGWQLSASVQGDRLVAGAEGPEAASLALLAWLEGLRRTARA